MTTSIPCPSCDTLISTDSAACPNCGAVFGAATDGAAASETLARLRAESPAESQLVLDDLYAALSGRFHGLRKLGQGGMGIVFVARDPLLKRDVAIKVLTPALAADPEAHERFIREAQAAAAVAHPNVVSVFQVGELPATRAPYFVMQFVAGQTLEQAHPIGRPVNEAVARRVIAEIAAALGAAHAHGLVHRDIKPSNVMLDPQTGRAIVLDFGISASVIQQPSDAKLTAPGMYLGTPRYMSPEQASGEEVTGKSDIYSLGCVAYELLAGAPAFDAKNPLALMAAHLRDLPAPIDTRRSGMDPELAAVVMRCLAKDPAQRPAAAEIVQRLTPGADVLLEWPPPGLEQLRDQYLRVTRVLAIGSIAAVVPAVAQVVGGSNVPSPAENTVGVLIGLVTLLGWVALAEAARRGFVLWRRLRRETRGGFTWLTLAEAISDPDGETGDLITGSRRFALLSPTERDRLRRVRLRRAGAAFCAAALPLPALALFLVLASWAPLSPTSAMVAWLVTPLAAVIALRATRHEERAAPRLRRTARETTTHDAARLVPDWNEAFSSARAGQPLGSETGDGTTSVRIAAGGALAVLAVTISLLVPLTLIAAIGSFGFLLMLPMYANTQEKVLLAEVARPHVVEKDPRISAAEAGAAFASLQPEIAIDDARFRRRPRPTPPERPWSTQPAPAALFPDTAPSGWVGPGSATILEVAARGVQPAQLAYLRMVATAPVWEAYGTVARANAGDMLGAIFVTPFGEDATWLEMPIPRFAATKELAYASVSRAAYHLAVGRRDSAETALRETIAYGFFVTDNANTLIEQLIGIVVVGIGRDALTRLYELTNDRRGPVLRAQWESLVRSRDLRLEIGAGSTTFALRDVAEVRRRVIASAISKDVSRGTRLEMLAVLGWSVCSNPREIIFGPDPEVRAAFASARADLARYPAEHAFYDLIEFSAERGIPRRDSGALKRALVGASAVLGGLLNNQRIRGCTELVLF